MAKTPLDGERNETYALTNADFNELRRLTIAAKDSAYCTRPPLPPSKPF